MQFQCNGKELTIAIDHVIVAGWTGRNLEAVEHHIKELAELGVAPPSQVPLFYRVSNALLTQASEMEVLGEENSGEVEPVLIKHGDKLYLGLGSDHTDRALEAYSVAASKQICAKPVANELWAFDEVQHHVDQIELRCWIMEDGNWVLYQEGLLASIRPLGDLMSAAQLQDNSAMLCGTLGAIGGVRPALEYKLEMCDPVLSKRIEMAYKVVSLPTVS